MIAWTANWSLILAFTAMQASPADSPPPARQGFVDRLPQRILEHWRNAPPRLVGSPNLVWREREVITVAFYGASEPVYELIESTAAEWTAGGAGIRFSFRDAQGRFRRWSPSDTYPAAAIRITFSEASLDGGYWSAVGTMAEAVPAREQTMNFGGFQRVLSPYYGRGSSPQWLQTYEHSTILHEFGHALGLSHEHFHPECQADLRISDAIAAFTGPPNNWTEEQARFNLDAEYYFRELSGPRPDGTPATAQQFDISPQIDRASVMLYYFDPAFYRSAGESRCMPASPLGFATSLSADDLASVLRYYPSRRR